MIQVVIQNGHGTPVGHHGPRAERRTDDVLLVYGPGMRSIGHVLAPTEAYTFALEPGQSLEVVCPPPAVAADPDLEAADAAKPDDVAVVEPPGEPVAADAADPDQVPAIESQAAP